MTEINKTTEEKTLALFNSDRTKRRWRMLAILSIMALLFVFILELFSTDEKFIGSDYIATIKVEGMILDDDFRTKQLERMMKDKHIKAVILVIDSQGGAIVPGLELLEELKELSKEKTLVVQMKSMATSAGYLISLAGEHVIANRASLTGSIGVLMPLVDATELADNIGIESSEITSGDLKAITSPLAKRSPKAQQYLQSTVNDLQSIFMSEVKARRDITANVEKTISDGRFLIGQKAYEYKLVDELGGKKQVLNYLYNNKNISADLPIVEIPLEDPEELNFKELLTSQISTGIFNKLESLINSTVLTPKMIAK